MASQVDERDWQILASSNGIPNGCQDEQMISFG
jgi:hypothetical protein